MPVALLDSLIVPVMLVIVLFVLAVGRLALTWAQDRGLAPRLRPDRAERPARRERGVGAVATEELHGLIYSGKRVQLEQRRIELVLRDDEESGAPPRSGIDLDAGTATIRRHTPPHTPPPTSPSTPPPAAS